MKIRLVLIITSLLTLLLSLAGGFTLLWRFFIFLVVVLFLSYLWPRLTIRGLGGRVEKPSEKYQVGQGFVEEFTVFNDSRLPTPLIEVREETDLPGYQNTAAFDLSSHESHSWRTRVICQHRGQYRLGTLTVCATDPLGLFPVSRQVGARQDIVVYPATLALPFFQTLPGQESGRNRRRWMASEAGPGAARVREYTSGDSLRHIHWQSTAHTGELMVKEFDPDRSNYTFRNIWIVADMHRGSRLGEGDESTEEYTITLAASLAKKYIDDGKRVGLIASGDRPYLFLPDSGEAHLHKMMHALALMKAAGKLPVDALLASQAERFDAGEAVIVIMPSGNEGITAALRRPLSRGTVVTAVLLDSLSFGGGASAAGTARNLIASGINVYVVRKGMELARVLDSRFLPAHAHYLGDKF